MFGSNLFQIRHAKIGAILRSILTPYFRARATNDLLVADPMRLLGVSLFQFNLSTQTNTCMYLVTSKERNTSLNKLAQTYPKIKFVTFTILTLSNIPPKRLLKKPAFFGLKTRFFEETMLSTLCSEASVSLPRLTPMERAKVGKWGPGLRKDVWTLLKMGKTSSHAMFVYQRVNFTTWICLFGLFFMDCNHGKSMQITFFLCHLG